MKLKAQERTAYDALLDDFLSECINYPLPTIVRRVAKRFFELGRTYNPGHKPPRYTGKPKLYLVKG